MTDITLEKSAHLETRVGVIASFVIAYSFLQQHKLAFISARH